MGISEIMRFKTYLSDTEYAELVKLFSKLTSYHPDLKEMWKLMDDVWDELGCCNKNIDKNKMSTFYNHPIWQLYGFFVEQHDISLKHRHAIADWIIQNREKINSVLDYGGGFGTLARIIGKRDLTLNIDIYEPHPSNIAIILTREFNNISYISYIRKKYDCLICLDVLEHCYDPINAFYEMTDSLKVGGFLIIANNFSSCIKCHLPSTFHLQYTFRFFAKLMGFKLIGPCHLSHADIFQKETEILANKGAIRKFESISKIIYPAIKKAHIHLSKLKKLLA